MKVKVLVFSLVALLAVALVGAALAARVKGTSGNDNLSGTEQHDRAALLAGDDVFSALGGPDFVRGGPGNDTLNGDDGFDWIFGGPGNDTLSGGDGPDFLAGGRDHDTLAGGDARDRLRLGPGADTATGGEGNDRIVAAADDNATDTIDCGNGDSDVVVVNANESDTQINCERVRTVGSS
jgi:Ca2+-binding RTX toxin-like protein